MQSVSDEPNCGLAFQRSAPRNQPFLIGSLCCSPARRKVVARWTALGDTVRRRACVYLWQNWKDLDFTEGWAGCFEADVVAPRPTVENDNSCIVSHLASVLELDDERGITGYPRPPL